MAQRQDGRAVHQPKLARDQLWQQRGPDRRRPALERELSGSCQHSGERLELKRLEVLDTTGVAGLAAMLSEGC